MKTEFLTTPASKKYPQTGVVMTIHAPAKEAFDYIAPIYLPRIFPGTSLIPGIVDTLIKDGWNKAGLSRTVYFKDGTTSQEILLTYNGPISFSYKNEQFTSKMLGALMTRLEGEWQFTDLKNGATKIESIGQYRKVFFLVYLSNIYLSMPSRICLSKRSPLQSRISRQATVQV